MKKVLLLFLCMIILVSGCEVKKMDEVTSADTFAREYSVSRNNPFVYASLNDIYELLENGSGIIFFGNSDCDVCSVGAKTLTEVLMKNNIEEAYYYNPKKIMNSNNKDYKKLIKLLGIDDFDIPSVFVLENGKIVDYNVDLAKLKEEDIDLALDESTKKDLKSKYNTIIKKYKSSN